MPFTIDVDTARKFTKLLADWTEDEADSYLAHNNGAAPPDNTIYRILLKGHNHLKLKEARALLDTFFGRADWVDPGSNIFETELAKVLTQAEIDQLNALAFYLDGTAPGTLSGFLEQFMSGVADVMDRGYGRVESGPRPGWCTTYFYRSRVWKCFQYLGDDGRVLDYPPEEDWISGADLLYPVQGDTTLVTIPGISSTDPCPITLTFDMPGLSPMDVCTEFFPTLEEFNGFLPASERILPDQLLEAFKCNGQPYSAGFFGSEGTWRIQLVCVRTPGSLSFEFILQANEDLLFAEIKSYLAELCSDSCEYLKFAYLDESYPIRLDDSLNHLVSKLHNTNMLPFGVIRVSRNDVVEYLHDIMKEQNQLFSAPLRTQGVIEEALEQLGLDWSDGSDSEESDG